MARYMAVYTWNGCMIAHFDDSYAHLSALIDEAFKDGIDHIQVYTLNRDNVYEHLLTIREHR